eukprot:g3456.t1
MTINFEELAENEEWQSMNQLLQKMTDSRVAFEEQQKEEKAAQKAARKARQKARLAKKPGGVPLSGPFRRPCGVPQELGAFKRLPVQCAEEFTVTQSLNEAWEALRFPALREAYDVIWHREQAPRAPPAPPARVAPQPPEPKREPRGRSRRRQHSEAVFAAVQIGADR